MRIVLARKTIRLRWLGCVVLATTMAAQVVPQSPAVNAGTALVPGEPANSANSVPSEAGGDSALRLGPGDLVDVSVYDVPDLDAKARVSSSGDVYLPLVNYVHVAGLTISEAGSVIEKRLSEGGFVRNPHVQILVQEFTSNGVSVLGEVTKPGVYPAMGEQTLFSMISAAGGFSERAGNAITVTRRQQPEKPLKVTVSRNLEDHPESNVPIFAGDTILVRRADVIYIVGDVAHPSGFLIDNSGHLTVLQAIALAGGTTSTAKLGGSRIIRKGPSGVSEIPVPLNKVLQAKVEDIPLEPNDILFVPTSARKILQGQTVQTALQFAAAASVVAVH